MSLINSILHHFGMEWTSRTPIPIPKDWDFINLPKLKWTPDQISYVSQFIRRNGQTEDEGWRKIAVVCLDAMRSPEVIELVSRKINANLNPGMTDHDVRIEGSHYLRGHPYWAMWADYAKQAVDAITSKV